MLIFRFLVLVAMVRLLIATNKPWMCAGVYGVLVAVATMMVSADLNAAVIAAAIGFVASGAYFWLLNRFEGNLIWWIVLIAGGAIIFF